MINKIWSAKLKTFYSDRRPIILSLRMMLVNLSQPQELCLILPLLMANQIRLIKKEQLKFVLLGKFTHPKVLETLTILETLWNLTRRLLLIIKLLLQIITNTESITMQEFHLVYQHWKIIEVFLYHLMVSLMEERIDHRLPLEESLAIVLERQQGKFYKRDTVILKVSNKALLQKD